MRAALQRYAYDALLVYTVHYHLTCRISGMYYGLGVQQYAHMGYFTFRIVKKGQVATLGMLQKIDQLTYLCLLVGIAGYGVVT